MKVCAKDEPALTCRAENIRVCSLTLVTCGNVIEAVELGASRREAAERFEVSVSSAVKCCSAGARAEALRRNRAEAAFLHWKSTWRGYWLWLPNSIPSQ